MIIVSEDGYYKTMWLMSMLIMLDLYDFDEYKNLFRGPSYSRWGRWMIDANSDSLWEEK